MEGFANITGHALVLTEGYLSNDLSAIIGDEFSVCVMPSMLLKKYLDDFILVARLKTSGYFNPK